MKEEKSEAIVLRSYIYSESSRILHLFTPHLGIIHLIVKRLSSKNSRLMNLATPFCHGEYVYRQGKSDLYLFLDGSILNLHLPLRQSLEALKYGTKMIEAIHTSQLPGTPAPMLYKLLAVYLKNLSLSPETLWVSFQLKLLYHEGLISLSDRELKSQNSSISFSETEWPQLLRLIGGRDFASLIVEKPSSTLKKSIDGFFRMLVFRADTI